MNIKKMWKEILLTAAVLGLFLLIVVQSILSAILCNSLEKELTKVTGCRTTIERCKVSLFPSLTLQVEKLVMTNPEGTWQESNVLSLGKCKAQIALLPLLSGRVHVTSFRLSESAIHYEVDKTGHSNVAQIITNSQSTQQKKEHKESSFSLSLSDFWIEGVNLSYVNKATGESYQCKDLRQLLVLTYDSKSGALTTRGKLSLSELHIKRTGQPTLLKGLTLALKHNVNANIREKRYTINKLSSSINDIALSMSGDISDTLLNLQITTDTLELDHLLKQIPQNLSPELPNLRAGGILALDVNAKGSLQQPKIQGNLTMERGLLRHNNLPDSLHRVTARATFTENSLSITEMSLRIGDDPIVIGGSVHDFSNPYIDASLKANLSMANVKRAIKLPSTHSVDGKITGEIIAKGRYNPVVPTALAVSGNIGFQHFTLQTPEIAHPIRLHGAITITPERINQNLSILLGKSDATCRGTVSHWQSMLFSKESMNTPRPTLSFTVHSNSLYLDSLLVQKGKQTRGKNTKGKSAQNRNRSGEVRKILPKPLPPIDLLLTLSADTLRHEGITVDNLKSKVSLKNSILNLSLDCDLFGGHIYSRQTLNGKSEKVTLTSTLNIADIDANRIISHYNDRLVRTKKLFLLIRGFDDHLYGKMSLRTKFQSQGVTNEDLQTNIRGSLTGSLTGGYIVGGSLTKALDKKTGRFFTLDNLHFQNLQTTIRIKNEQLFFDTLNIHSRRLGDWHIFGSVGFDASLQVGLENRLPLNISQKISGVSDKVKGSVTGEIKKKIKGPWGTVAASLVDKQGIQSDDKGRVTIALGISGTVTDPSLSKLRFKKAQKSDKAGIPNSQSSEQQLKGERRKKQKEQEKKARKKLEKEAERRLKRKLTRKEKRALKERSKKMQKKLPKNLKKVFQ